MSRVTLSDFVVSLCDLAEAEGRTLQKSVQDFMSSERQAVQSMLLRSGSVVVLTGAAIFCVLAALVCFTWGIYTVCSMYISPVAAPFITAGVWLIGALVFLFLAKGSVTNG